jgi:hypothetical protein
VFDEGGVKMVNTRPVLVVVAAIVMGAGALSGCSRRADDEEGAKPAPAPQIPPPPAEPPTQAAPDNTIPANAVSNMSSVNDGAFSPDYAPASAANAPTSGAAPQR